VSERSRAYRIKEDGQERENSFVSLAESSLRCCSRARGRGEPDSVVNIKERLDSVSSSCGALGKKERSVESYSAEA